MRRILIILIALTLALPCYAQDFVYFKKKAVAGGGGDSCTGGLLLSAHFENSDTITDGTPAGCSVGDSTWTKSGATIAYSSDNVIDGTYSLYNNTATLTYARLDISSEDIINVTEGKAIVYIRPSDVANGGAIFTSFGDGTNYLRGWVVAGGVVRLTRRTTADGQISASTVETLSNNTWYKLTFKWKVTGSPNTLSVQVDEGTPGVSTSALSSFATASTVFEIGDGAGSSIMKGYFDAMLIYSASDLP